MLKQAASTTCVCTDVARRAASPSMLPLQATSRALVVGLALAVSSMAFAHGGGLDGYGCHHNRKVGGYHCHQGPLAGHSYSSQEEMRDELAPGVLPYSAGVEAAGPKKSKTKPQGSVESRLRQLDDLRDKGLVTDDEYANKRKAILEDF